ncbi:MAG: ABC transporter permease [Polaribacter sp.]
MLRLLTIEFHKLKHNTASKVLIIVYFTLITLIALIAAIKFDIGPIQFHLADMGIFNFPYIWHFNTFIAALLKFFLLLVIVSMMANEYSYKTLKQNLIDGLSKKEFILSKFYTVIAFAFISTVFIFLVSLILGLFYSDYNEFAIITSDLEYLFAFFLKLVGFFSMGLFFGILIKRSAFAVGGLIIYFFIEFFSYLYIAGSNRSQEFADSIYQFFPFKSLWNLIEEPFSRLGAVRSVASQVGETFTKSYDVEFTTILIVSVWTYIFIYLSYALLKKRDL